ncbi:MAG TPA: GntR family transcriptional regulator [Lacisediminihabitans sp.]|jgi:DNA-binding transcriptional regulator YhcF (GntR family)|nr:GntR family transcriptional regulator [Lacisediminihabitans sp.]HXD62581.1 GntR family transcriptional regulator [Lacisediminihabitans sp.]
MLTVDPRSAVPPFEQLRVQLLEQVQSGELAFGAKLPTVRRLAEDLGLAPGTVARTYRELEQNGIIQTRGRNGTFVAWSRDEAERLVQDAASAYADRIRSLGFDSDRAVAIVQRALSDDGNGSRG